MGARIVVIGSTNMDLVAKLDRLPATGETVSGGTFSTSLGGKGANQAVAAARLGGEVMFVTSVGNDPYGHQAVSAFQKDGINLDFLVMTGAAPTGVALIMVGENGENIIAVVPGANHLLLPDHVLKAEKVIKKAACVLIQLEIPMETVEAAVEIAAKHHVPIILNPAPAQSIPDSILRRVTTLTPNEIELAQLVGITNENENQMLAALKRKTGIENLILTVGKRGALIYGDPPVSIPAPEVQAVDTTAAGDAFNGALAVALSRGEGLEEAVRFANIVAAISVTKMGAQASLPTIEELDIFLKNPSGLT